MKKQKKMPQVNESDFSSRQLDNFRMYHQLQYDRIDKLESKRETFSNLVLTLSAGIYLLGLGSIEELNPITGKYLSIIVILVNIAAIIFANKSRYWIKLHQERAKVARNIFAPELEFFNREANENYENKLSKQWWSKLFQSQIKKENEVPPETQRNEPSGDKPIPEKGNDDNVEDKRNTKRESDRDWLRRERIYQYLHLAVIAISVFSIYSYTKLKQPHDESSPMKIEISKLPKISIDFVDTIKVKSFPTVRDSIQ